MTALPLPDSGLTPKPQQNINRGLLVDCIARILTEQKVDFPIGSAELRSIRTFLTESKLSKEEKELVLNHTYSVEGSDGQPYTMWLVRSGCLH